MTRWIGDCPQATLEGLCWRVIWEKEPGSLCLPWRWATSFLEYLNRDKLTPHKIHEIVRLCHFQLISLLNCCNWNPGLLANIFENILQISAPAWLLWLSREDRESLKIYLEIRSLKRWSNEAVRMGPLSDISGVLNRRGNLDNQRDTRNTHATRDAHTRTQQEGKKALFSKLKREASEASETCQYLNPECLASRTIRKEISVKSSSLWCFVMAALANEYIRHCWNFSCHYQGWSYSFTSHNWRKCFPP